VYKGSHPLDTQNTGNMSSHRPILTVPGTFHHPIILASSNAALHRGQQLYGVYIFLFLLILLAGLSKV